MRRVIATVAVEVSIEEADAAALDAHNAMPDFVGRAVEELAERMPRVAVPVWCPPGVNVNVVLAVAAVKR